MYRPHKYLVKSLKVRYCFRLTCVHGKIILKWIFKMLLQVVVENIMIRGNEYFRAKALAGSVEVSKCDV